MDLSYDTIKKNLEKLNNYESQLIFIILQSITTY